MRSPGRTIAMYGGGMLLADRYRLGEQLGSGGMGEVWRATDEVLGRIVAVKVMRPQLVAQPGFAERFLAEARAMATVKHPAVVDIYDYRGDVMEAFLVMELIEGEPLSSLLERTGRLSPAATMALVAQTADALQAAHDKGIVHRDVKPANLLVTADDRVALTDFGIARADTAAQLTVTGQVIGTPSYLAPEQVLGHRATPQSDLYALGVVAYQCLSGRLPFTGENSFAIATQRLSEPPAPLDLDVPAGVAAVVYRALAAESPQRWACARDLADAARATTSPGASHVEQPTQATQPMQHIAPTMRILQDPNPTPPTRYQPPTPVQPKPTRTATPPPRQEPPPPPRGANERRRPRRPRIPLVAGAFLGVVAACLAVYAAILWSLRPDIATAIENRLDDGTFGALADAVPILSWTVIGAYGVLTMVILLLAVLTAVGSRAARGRTFTWGIMTLLIAAPLGVVGAFLFNRLEPDSPFERELVAIVPSSYPQYITIAGITGMAAVLIAMVLIAARRVDKAPPSDRAR